MEHDPLIVVIDGPAGAGKTTVARQLARHLQLPLLDTGAIYRTLALIARRRAVSWDDEAGLTRLCGDFPIAFGALDSQAGPEARQQVTFDGEDITTAIRTPEISEGASQVSAHRSVRAALLPIQRALGAQGCVAEGRDMGTVVFPHAKHKFFLTADLSTRARRRQAELAERGGGVAPELTDVEHDMRVRDTRDSSRETAPLAQAPDAEGVDTSTMDARGVVQHILGLIQGGENSDSEG
jgi:cytidylate kinase